MLRCLAYLFFCLVVTFSFAQAPLEPEFKIPSSIAKLPDRFDFADTWLRVDGTYKLEVEVSAGGVIARYLNPKSIHVESADFVSDSGQIMLSVILRDEGYPGSEYRLVFVPEYQILNGVYIRSGSAPAQVSFVKERR